MWNVLAFFNISSLQFLGTNVGTGAFGLIFSAVLCIVKKQLNTLSENVGQIKFQNHLRPTDLPEAPKITELPNNSSVDNAESD